jgi:hypothetical protein
LSFSVAQGPFDSTDVPFTSITVCAHGTSHCAVVNNVVLDTGSIGLRVFGSQLEGLGITPNTTGGGGTLKVGECGFFGAGVTWGAVSTVDVKIAGEPTITIPIQVMDDIGAFERPPDACTMGSTLLGTPTEAGFNGLLGVGQVPNDEPNLFADYYACFGEDCMLYSNPATSTIVLNPVSSFPVDNNGVVMTLPSIPDDGAPSVTGTLYFGIGTESNNQPGTVQVYDQDSDSSDDTFLTINSIMGGITSSSFFDSGANGIFFDSPITSCPDSGESAGFYCPPSTIAESAMNQGFSGSPTGTVNFSIANAQTLFSSDDVAFDNIGGSFDGGTSFDGFDWGLPFFFGRTVYIGIDGASSSLGTGPYTAY